MKLLVSDIDGTIYVDYKINFEVKKFIKEFINKNNLFILATGRNFPNFLYLIQQEKIHYNYCILCNGAFVLDNKFNILLSVKFEKKHIKGVLEYIEKNNIIADITASFDYQQIFYFTNSNIIEFYNKIPNQINCLSIKLKCENLDFKNVLKKIKRFNVEVNGKYIDIVPENVNKGKIVSLFMKRLSIDKHDTIIIGDSENDFSMFALAENSFYITNEMDNRAKYCIENFENFIEIIKSKI